MLCKYCGAQLDADTKFCGACGKATTDIVATETKTEPLPSRTPASSSKRLLNLFLDQIGVYIFSFVVLMVIGSIFPSQENNYASFLLPYIYIFVTFGFLKVYGREHLQNS